MTTPTDLTIDATAPVEAAIGPRTSAWLVSMGWTPPSPPAPDGVELVNETVHMPAPSMEQAVAENEERAQRLLTAQALYQGLKAEASVPEELDQLLEYFGVKLSVFARPLMDDSASAAS